MGIITENTPDLKLKSLLHPWVIIPALGIGALLMFCALSTPLNYWHHSKFGHAEEQFFNDFFPLIHLFEAFLPGTENAPINDGNFIYYNILAAIVSFIALWGIMFLVFRFKSKVYQLLTFIILISAIPFFWTTSFALNQALLLLGIVMTLVVIATELYKKPVISLVILSIALFFSVGSAILGLALCLAVALNSFHLKKGLIIVPLTIIIALSGVYLLSGHLMPAVSKFLSTGNEHYHVLNGEFVKQQDVSYTLILNHLFEKVNPILLLGFLSLALLKGFKKDQVSFTTWAMIGFTLILSVPFKEVLLQGNHFMLFLVPLFVLTLISALHMAAQKWKMIRWPAVALTLLTCLYGLSSWISPSPLNYMDLALPYESTYERDKEENIDYLNTAAFMALSQLDELESEYDTLALNFYHNHPLPKAQSQILMSYLQKDRKTYDLGVFVRRNLPPAAKGTAAFPASNAVVDIEYRGISLATVSQPHTEIRRSFKRLYKQRPGNSVVAFRALTDTFPRNPEAWHGLARSQFLFSTWDDALKSCHAGLALNPSHLELICLKGEVYRKQGRNDEALAEWDKCLSMYKGYAKAWWLKGEYYLREGDLAEARNQLINAKYCQGHYSGRAVKAMQAIDSAETNPKFTSGIEEFFINSINTLGEDNAENRERANELASEMLFYLDLDSTNAQLRSHYGLVQLMLEDFGKASMAFEKAIEMNPNYPQMREYLAIARSNWGAEMYQQDSLEQAIFHFKYALDYSPENINARQNLSVGYVDLAGQKIEENDLEGAYKLIRAAIYYDRDNADAFNQMGNLKMIVNQPDSAEIAYNQAFMLDNTNIQALEQLIELETGRNDANKLKILKDRLKQAKALQRREEQ